MSYGYRFRYARRPPRPWAVIVGGIATLVIILGPILGIDWFWTYKWWLLGALGIVVLGGGAVAMAHYIRRRHSRDYLETEWGRWRTGGTDFVGGHIIDIDESSDVMTEEPSAVEGLDIEEAPYICSDQSNIEIIRHSAPPIVSPIAYRGSGSERDSSEEIPIPPGTDTTDDPVVIPHKITPRIAIASGLLAILSLSSTMVLITNLTEATPGLIIAYVVVAVLGVTSFGLGLLILKARSKVLNSLRSEWQRLQERYRGSRRVPDQVRRLVAQQRDALLISGDLVDADRAAAVLRSLPSRG